MMIAQVDRRNVTDDAASAGTAAPSRPLSILPAGAKPTDRLDRRQRVQFSGSTAACAGFRKPAGEASQRMADGSANDRGARSHMGNPGPNHSAAGPIVEARPLRSLLSAGPVVGLLASIYPAAMAAGPVTHNTASLTAAELAPEPFATNWEKCRYANHPDHMRDQPLGHENMRTSGILYTLEAIRYLREGQINRAMMVASARTHYVTDSACLPHAEIWRPRREDDTFRPGEPSSGPWSFMPASVQSYWLPFGGQPEGAHYQPLVVNRPPIKQDAWDALKERDLYGSIHAFFDSIDGQAPYPDGFPIDGIDRAEYWSCYDREFHARWRAECIALMLLDRESVLDDEPGVRWVDAEAF